MRRTCKSHEKLCLRCVQSSMYKFARLVAVSTRELCTQSPRCNRNMVPGSCSAVRMERHVLPGYHPGNTHIYIAERAKRGKRLAPVRHAAAGEAALGTMSMSDNDVDIEALNRLVSFGSAGDLTQAELSELTKSLGTDDIFGGEEISEGRQEIVTDIEASPPHEIAEIVAGSSTPETISYGSGGASPNRSGERCWANLLGDDCMRCSEGGGEKLIDKFCSVCRTTGVRVAADRVRALLPEQYDRFANSRKEGFWTEGSGGTPRFRVVNHTKECSGAWLVLFEKEPVGVPIDWAPIPPDWLETEGWMRLWLSKSTMVPRG